MKLLIVLLVFSAALASAAFKDPCSQYSSDCFTCIGHYLCGWCSYPVVYPGNVTGTQCAGFNPDEPNPFVCNGIYSTDECVRGYVCDMHDFTCKLGDPGDGTTKELCEKNCTNTGQVFLCNITTHKCHEVPPGTPGAASLEVCEKNCIHITPTSHTSTPHPTGAQTYECNYTTGECDPAEPGHGSSKEVCEKDCKKGDNETYFCNQFLAKCVKLPPGGHGESLAACEKQCNATPNPGPPPDFTGMWRGIEIQHDYVIGEWDMHFDETSATIVDVKAAVTIKGVPMNVKNGDTLDLWVKITAGPGVGQIIKAFGELSGRGPETKFLTAAFTAPGGKLPASIDDAMSDGTSKVFFLQQCIVPECVFTMPNSMSSTLRKISERFGARGTDPCSQYKHNCSECLAHKFCGWCSTNVIYKDGQPGTQCAGWSSDPNSTNPFICQGRYSTMSCTVGYDCDNKTSTCVPDPIPGNGMPKDECEALCKPTPQPTPVEQYVCNTTDKQCYKCNSTHCPGSMPKTTCIDSCVHPKPGPSTLVAGYWRGIQISNHYPLAEFDWAFNSSGVQVYKDGKQIWAGGIVSYGGDVMQFDVTSGEGKGKRFSALYTIAEQGSMYEVMTIAVGKADGDIPDGYAGPMSTPGEYEQVLAKCVKEPLCKFTPPE